MAMEDFKWIFYVVVAIVYFIAKSRNKKTAAPTSENQPQQASTSKPVTFEDLLKEIQQSKAPAPKPEPKPVIAYQPPPTPKYQPAPKYVDYDDDVDKDEKDLEDVPYNYRDQDKIYETYEKAKKEAFNRPSLEETMKVEDTVVRYGQFKEYEKHVAPSVASTIAKDFKDKGNIRKAFILSEILNRRHWFSVVSLSLNWLKKFHRIYIISIVIHSGSLGFAKWSTSLQPAFCRYRTLNFVLLQFQHFI